MDMILEAIGIIRRAFKILQWCITLGIKIRNLFSNYLLCSCTYIRNNRAKHFLNLIRMAGISNNAADILKQRRKTDIQKALDHGDL